MTQKECRILTFASEVSQMFSCDWIMSLCVLQLNIKGLNIRSPFVLNRLIVIWYF